MPTFSHHERYQPRHRAGTGCGLLFVVGLLSGFFQSSVSAQVNLPVSADSYTHTSLPDKNYGTGSEVQTNTKKTGYYRFDLASIGSGTTVVLAELHLPLASVKREGMVAVHTVLGDWTESGLTLNNTPGFDSAASVSYPVSFADEAGTLIINVTGLVQGWVTDPSSNFGLALPKPSGDTTSIRVTSREAGTGAALVVTTSSGGGNLPPDAGDATVTPEGVGAIGLSITADTFTNTGAPDKNFGDNSNVRSNSKRVGYYRFDLSSVAPGTLVVSAELELHVQTVNQGGPVDLHGILGGWSELNLTANNTPGFDAVADASLLISSADVDGVVSVDVTALVQQWVANPAANFGLALARPSGSSTSVFFSSRESGLGAVLNISTVPADPVAGSNIAPAIDGAPLATVMAETEYLFTPDATDADGDLLHFSIENRPSWAVFDTQTGTLWGVPGPNNVGTTGNIVISVSDAQASTSLAAFTVTVSPSGQGSVVLNWLPPTENDDGSSLTNLGSYRIYYGTSPEELNSTIDINNPGLTSYVVGNLSPDTYYFAATAISSDGVESDLSAIVVYLVN